MWNKANIWRYLVLITLLTPLLLPTVFSADSIRADPRFQFDSPSQEHLLGRDHLGRDILSRLLVGFRNSLKQALLSTVIATSVGILLGLSAAYLRPQAGMLILGFINVLLSCPTIILSLAIVGLIGQSSLSVPIAVGISLSPVYARLVRGATILELRKTFIDASFALGGSTWWVVRKHLIRNLRPLLVGYALIILSWSMLNAATLDFLRLNGDLAIPTLGQLISEGRNYLFEVPQLAISSSIVIGIFATIVFTAVDQWQATAF